MYIFLAIAKLKIHLDTVISAGDNPLTVRRGARLVDDFLGVMSTEQFKRNFKKRIAVRFISEETDF